MTKTLGDCLFDGGIKGVIFKDSHSGEAYQVIELSRSPNPKERELVIRREFLNKEKTKGTAYLFNHYDDESAPSQSKHTGIVEGFSSGALDSMDILGHGE